MREKIQCEVLSGIRTYPVETFRSVRTHLDLVCRLLPSGVELDDSDFLYWSIHRLRIGSVKPRVGNCQGLSCETEDTPGSLNLPLDTVLFEVEEFFMG